MQQRIQANNSSNAAAARRAEAERDDLDESEQADEAAFLRNQRLNLYGNLALAGSQGAAAAQQYAHSASNSLAQEGALNLGLSMGVNIGTYGYQAGTGNLLQQLNYTNVVRSADSPPETAEEEAALRGEEEEDLQEAEEEDCEDEEEEFEDCEDEADENDDDDDAGEEGDDIVDEEENDLECYLRNVSIENGRIRARTAPLRPMEQIEQFKMTPNFTNLEQAAVCAVQIVQRNDQKFDLDSFEGQNSCKKFLSFIEKLCDSLKIKSQNRTYRKTFSNAYKVLYKEGKLCYLTEILDSAQEAFPYLYVNGEKYVFSK